MLTSSSPSASHSRLLPVGAWPFWLGPVAWLLVVGLMLAHSAITSQRLGALVLLQFVLYAVIALGVPWLWARLRKPPMPLHPDDWGLQRQPAWRWLAATAVLAALLYLLNTGGQGLPSVPAQVGMQVKASMGLGRSVLGDVLMVLAITAVAPLAEELVFRGLIYRSMRDGLARWLPLPATMLLAWLAASAAFVYTHGGSAPPAQLALMATLFTLAFELGRSLWAAIALHALNNTFTLWLGLSGLIGSATPAFAAPWIWGLAMAGPVIALALTALLRVALKRCAARC